MENSIRFCILLGSARIGGNSPGISQWVNTQLENVLQASFATVPCHDVVIINPHTKPHPVNPVLDEIIPAMRNSSESYSSQEVRDWSRFIRSCDAVIVVTPQYNWGYPGTLKTAIDVLYYEWHGKPASIVAFGGHGGSKADEQLRQVMSGGVKMDVVEQKVQVSLPKEYIRGSQRVAPSDAFLEQYAESLHVALRQLIDKVTKVRSAAVAK